MDQTKRNRWSQKKIKKDIVLTYLNDFFLFHTTAMRKTRKQKIFPENFTILKIDKLYPSFISFRLLVGFFKKIIATYHFHSYTADRSF